MKQPAKKITIEKKAPLSTSQRNLFWLGSGVVILVIGLYQAISLRWVSDDAFITFRYVKNFVEGHGIVYNIGEYVEGYTHFLWLLILSGAKFIGFDPVDASIWLGIASYAGILVLYILITKKEYQRAGHSSLKFSIPLAALLLALNYDMTVWASGGLETALYTFLISLSFYCWFYTDLTEKKKVLTVGGILLLATLTRPDGALFILTGAVLIVIKGIKQKFAFIQIAKTLGLLVLPVFIIGIPYLFWKYNYYGDIFPSTYYAKSADQNYFGQGFFYIWLFFKVYFSSAIAIIFFAVALFLRKNRLSNESKKIETGRLILDGSPIITASIAIVIYLVLNVARVGGDFMFARFIIPVLPLLYFIIERLIERLPASFDKYKMAIPLLLISSVIIENTLREKILFHFDPQQSQLAGNWGDDGSGETRGIADERWVYANKRLLINGTNRSSLDVYSDVGKFYEPIFRDLPVTVAIQGGQNMIAYYANFRTVINTFGLTDTAISHMAIAKPGRIGHEKIAPNSYLIKRGVQFVFFGIIQKKPEEVTYNVSVFEIPDLGLYQYAKIFAYDKDVTQELQKRLAAAGSKSALGRIDEIVSEYLSNMQSFPVDELELNYMEFKKLLWSKYPDPISEKKMLDCIAEKKKNFSADK